MIMLSFLQYIINTQAPVKCKLSIESEGHPLQLFQLRFENNRHHVVTNYDGKVLITPFQDIQAQDYKNQIQTAWDDMMKQQTWKAVSLHITTKDHSNKCIDYIHELQNYMETHARCREAAWDYVEKIKN